MKSIKILTGPRVLELAKNKISDSDIIIDGIFSTGIKGEIFSSAIDLINASNAYVVAVDIPSGLDPNDGIFHEKCVKLMLQLPFIESKRPNSKKRLYRQGSS